MVQSVVVHTSIDSGADETIEAERLTQWRPELEHGVGAEYLERIVRIEQDVWNARLVAPDDGQTLTYQIEADGVLGESYTLVGAEWRSEGSIEVNILEANRY